MNILYAYIEYVSTSTWWQFWNPAESGAIGGMIFGSLLALVIIGMMHLHINQMIKKREEK